MSTIPMNTWADLRSRSFPSGRVTGPRVYQTISWGGIGVGGGNGLVYIIGDDGYIDEIWATASTSLAMHPSNFVNFTFYLERGDGVGNRSMLKAPPKNTTQSPDGSWPIVANKAFKFELLDDPLVRNVRTGMALMIVGGPNGTIPNDVSDLVFLIKMS